MKSLRLHYPWQKLEKGQGFFIPCLDPDPIKEEGLQQAIRLRMFNAKAKVGIKDGRYGVNFYLLRP
jgi:hypothetical protein